MPEPISAASTPMDLSTIEKLLRDIRWELQQSRKFAEITRNVVASDTLEAVATFVAERQLSFRATLERIADSEASFSRFGDGELRMMLRCDYALGFQPNSPELQEDLLRTFASPHESVLLGFPHAYRDLHWTTVWTDIWPSLSKIIPTDVKEYGNSHVSRPVFFQFMGNEGVRLWRKVWDKKRVCVITGANSRFELIDPLFDNVASVERIDSTPQNGYGDLRRILDVIEAQPAPDLYLIALGPAGTVLTNEIAVLGRRAIDVGHISDSYLNVHAGGKWPEQKPAIR
ncbi:MAG: hypothetical protein JWN06_2960 [Propionibacteriaceae bacterium]|jgi:hypothetical protein|nr:hypothetical protein [Propionibacteriaceae bacterium]